MAVNYSLVANAQAEQTQFKKVLKPIVRLDRKKIDEAAKSFLDKMKKGVEENEYSWIAQQFRYPICVDINCREVSVSTPQELLKFIDHIFTDNIKKCILDQKREDLVPFKGSYMIGHGQIWFDPGYIHRVSNNSGSSVFKCSGNKIEQLPRKYYGTWKICRTASVGGSLNASLINASMNKEIHIEKNSFSSEAKLFTNLKDAEWLTEESESKEDNEGNDGSLLWYGRPEALPNSTKWVYACSRSQKYPYLEITNQGELACYWDGCFIFMKKIARKH